jgi:hypothetical protein
MSAILSLYSLTLAHGDAVPNNNPSLRFVDWKRAHKGVSVENPRIEAIALPPGAEKLVFNGVRTTDIDGTTALDLEPIAANRYRLTHSAGTDPGFRVDRGLDLTGVQISFLAQANGSILATAGAGFPFLDLQVGDGVYVGPGSGFDAMNQGFWTVLGSDGSGVEVVLVRDGDFLGLSEVATPSAPGQILGYSQAGVQVGDKLNLSAGFAATAQKTYEVLEVTSNWVTIFSSTPLATQTGVTPGAAGMQFYTGSKRFLRIEADQETVLKLNGDTGSLLRLSPWQAGDPEQVAEFTKVGPTWSLTVVNRSAQTLNLTVISAE